MNPSLFIIPNRSITPAQGGPMAQKPSIEEVLKYAKGNIIRFIGQYAADLPMEQKEEIEQTVYVRLIQVYEGLDADAGWKSYVFNHCRGGVLDYVKFGKGFEESKWSIQKEEETGSQNISKIKTRITEVETDDKDGESIDEILSRCGISSSVKENVIRIRWDLVAHMAAQDEILHAFAKFVIGFSVDEISQNFGLCHSRISQLIQAFVDRFDEPMLAEDVWFLQTLYAFGLCRHFNVPDVDQSEVHGFPIGWGSRKVDLYDDKPFETDSQKQMSLFDVG